MPHIQVKKLHPAAQLPRYAHTGDFGDLAADLYAVEAVTLSAAGLPGCTLPVPTGIALGFPAGFGALIQSRSGLAVKGVSTLGGVIDPGYRGEIKVILTNLNAEPFAVCVGDRIGQLRIVERIEATFEETDALGETRRSDRGFGSTGQ